MKTEEEVGCVLAKAEVRRGGASNEIRSEGTIGQQRRKGEGEQGRRNMRRIGVQKGERAKRARRRGAMIRHRVSHCCIHSKDRPLRLMEANSPLPSHHRWNN